ncbi:MAG: hypothetical protein HZA51_13025 [Planctomycetes bacterium]|nr:hypothetical protein [Planctomycetota bacterium]
MKSAIEQAVEAESGFLAGVQANIKAAGSKTFAGTTFAREDHDRAEHVRAAMVDRRIYDRKKFDMLPQGRGFTIRGFERQFIFWKKLKSVTVATVLAPPGPLLDGDGRVEPVNFATLDKHVRSLVRDGRVPHVIGVCSPSGFAADAWNTPVGMPNVRVVLVEPTKEGGWKTGCPGGPLDERLIKLFDPEGPTQKVDRVRREIEARSTDLLIGGLSAADMAKDLGIPLTVAQAGFESAAKSDPELRVTRQAGDVILYRGAASLPTKEDDSMSLTDWIKSLFSKEGDEAAKVNVLKERRAALSTRLDRMYDDIGKLEKREQELVTEGKSASSNVVKRRLAAQIAHMRKDISRCNTSAAVVSKQINIISTHIHNLELAQAGSVAQLPSSDELTEAAVNAEEILEQLTVSDGLVSDLEVGLAQSAVSEDEAAILKELEGDKPAVEKQDQSRTVAQAQEGNPPETKKERGPAQAE